MLLTYEPTGTAPDRGSSPCAAFAPRSSGCFGSCMLWPAIDPGLQTVLRPHDRLPVRPRLPLQHLGPGPSLEPLRIAILVATAALSIALRLPSPAKSLVQVAALGAPC